MGVQIEELRAYFTANYAGYLKGAKAVQDAAKGLASGADASAKKIANAFKTSQQIVQSVGPQLQKVGNAASSALNRISVAAGGIITKTATSFGQFELTMKRAGAVTNTLGTETFKRLEDAAIEMGRTTVYSAAEAAAAVEKLGLAGLKADEVMKALPGALELAASAQVDIATAADVAAKTMRAFGEDADALSHINDVLVKTFTTANTDMRQLAEAMKYAAPVAKGLGVSLEDASTIIAKMSDAGFQGSIAGTSLANVMSTLAGGKTPAAIEKLKSFGVESLTAAGKMRPLFDILEDIQKSGMSTADVLQIFGDRGGRQLIPILELTTAELREYSQSLKDAAGIAKNLSDANIDTLWGSFKMLESELETVVNDLGKSLKPTLESVFHAIIDNKSVLINLANQFADWFQWLVKLAIEHPKLTSALIALRVSGLLGLNKLLATVVMSLGSLGASLASAAAKAGMAQTAMTGLRTAGLTAIIALVAALAWEFSGASKVIADFNAQLQKSRELSGELKDVRDGQVQKVIDQAKEEGGDKGKSTLQSEIDFQKKEIEGLESLIRGQRNAVSQRDTLFNSAAEAVGFGTEHSEEAANLADLEQKLKEAKSRVQQLDEAMKNLGSTSAKTGAEAAGAFSGVASPSLVGDGSEADQTVRDAVLASHEANNGGFRGVLDLVQGGASGDQLRDYLSAIDTSNGQFNPSDAGAELDSINSSGGFESQQQLDAFAMRVAQTLQAAAEAEEQRLQTIEEEKARIAEIPEVLKSMEDTAVDIKTQLMALDEETAGPLAGALQDIQERFAAGKMSADDFTATMQKLKSATDQATAAAKREEEQKLREQILKGDFSGLNPMQALEDKLFQFRMQQFNGGVDAMFNQMMGLGNAVAPVVSGFNNLTSQMQDFGSQLQGSMQPGGGAGNAGAAIFSWLNSLDGIAASLYNNISMLNQSLQFIQDPRRRQEIFDQIDAMQNQLSNLYQTPYTVGDAFDNIQDPGIGSGSNSISISLPNISRVTNADVRMLTDAIARELDQRGRRY